MKYFESTIDQTLFAVTEQNYENPDDGIYESVIIWMKQPSSLLDLGDEFPFYEGNVKMVSPRYVKKKAQENPWILGWLVDDKFYGDSDCPFAEPTELLEERARLAAKALWTDKENERLAELNEIIDNSNYQQWQNGYFERNKNKEIA